MGLELPQGSVVVEQDRSSAGTREPLPDSLLESPGRAASGAARRGSRLVYLASRERNPSAQRAAVELLDTLAPSSRGAAVAPRVDSASACARCSTTPSTSHGLTRSAPGSACADPGELREEERPAPATGEPRLGLAEDELVRDEVHPVPERRDHHHVGSPVERDERGLRDVAMHVLDRRHPGLPEAAVDAGDEELDLVALRPVLGALEPRRHDHLHHRRRLRAVGILLEEALERLELLRDALRVVEPLDAEDEMAALVLLFELREQALRSPGRRAPPGSRRRRFRSDRPRCRRAGRRTRASRARESMPRMRRHDERKCRA